MVWLLEPESLNIGYLDPSMGHVIPGIIPFRVWFLGPETSPCSKLSGRELRLRLMAASVAFTWRKEGGSRPECAQSGDSRRHGNLDLPPKKGLCILVYMVSKNSHRRKIVAKIIRTSSLAAFQAFGHSSTYCWGLGKIA